MSATKISASLRENIAKDVRAYFYGEKIEKIINERAAAGDVVYFKNPLIAGNLEKILDFPKSFLRHSSGEHFFKLSSDPMASTMLSGEKYLGSQYIHFTEPRVCPILQAFIVDPDDSDFVRYIEIDNKHTEMIGDSWDLMKKIDSLLVASKTVERAILTWPEGADFLEKYKGSPKIANLPSVTCEEINNLISKVRC